MSSAERSSLKAPRNLPQYSVASGSSTTRTRISNRWLSDSTADLDERQRAVDEPEDTGVGAIGDDEEAVDVAVAATVVVVVVDVDDVDDDDARNPDERFTEASSSTETPV